MKLTVTKGFIDKDTNIFHSVGSVVEYPEKRAKEIEYRGFGKCEEPKPSKAKAKEKEVAPVQLEEKSEQPINKEIPKKVNRKK